MTDRRFAQCGLDLMLPSLLLVGCSLVTGQTTPLVPPPERADWLVHQQLEPGQEFVYGGTFQEETSSPVQHSSSCRLETRVLVLDAARPAYPVALFTVLRAIDTRLGAPRDKEGPILSVRLQRGSLGERGHLTADPRANLTVPLDGPPSLEVGVFIDLPGERLSVNQTWDVAEKGRPIRTWRVIGAEPANGVSCVKIVGEQKTDDWNRPRLDRIAWRRVDTIWLAPRVGVAYRLERVIEKREPGHDQPTQRSVLRFDLVSSIPYTGQLFDDRRQEALQALTFSETAAPLLPAPAAHRPQLNALANKIAYHLEREPPTPYREAVLQVSRYVEAGKRGEVPIQIEPDSPEYTVTVGDPAPDFLATVIGVRASTSLRRWLGKPILLVFFNPNSSTLDQLLPFAQRVALAYPQGVTVLGLAVSDEADLVLEKTNPLRLSFPLINGTGLRRSYAVEATPKMVVIDGAGVVRATYLGWGNEIPLEVVEELKRWMPKK